MVYGEEKSWNYLVICFPKRDIIITLNIKIGLLLKDSSYRLQQEFGHIGPVVRVFANGPADLGSIPGSVIPKTLKMVLDTSLFNTQQYKVRIKGKVE